MSRLVLANISLGSYDLSTIHKPNCNLRSLIKDECKENIIRLTMETTTLILISHLKKLYLVSVLLTLN